MQEVPVTDTSKRPHTLTLDACAHAVITGVESVDCFNEQLIVLTTSMGTLTLVGENMHVNHLNLIDGQLRVEGHISGLEYDRRTHGRKSGLAKRLLR